MSKSFAEVVTVILESSTASIEIPVPSIATVDDASSANVVESIFTGRWGEVPPI